MNGATKNIHASKLGDILAQLSLNLPNQWIEVEATAQRLADDLRAKDVEQQTALGKTLLPQTLTSLLKGALDGASIPQETCKPAIYEILRVAANLCMDHDDNRGYLLEAGFPQTVLSILEGYAESVQSNQPDPLPLSIPDLKLVKTSIGLLLNASIGYEPVKSRLISLEAAMTILKLAMSVYPPGSWLRSQQSSINGTSSGSDEVILETWNLRSGLSSWAWRAITELRGDEGDNPEAQAQSQPLFGSDALPFLVKPLKAFTPPYPSPPPLFAASPARRALVQADFDVLEEVCGLLESLSLDVEDVRLSLARGLIFYEGEHGGVACLSDMLTFVDQGDYPPYWSSESPGERATMEKAFDICKAAIIKAVVEVAGEEKNTDTLWDDSQADKPGGEFVSRMVQWIRTHKSLKETNRDDLVICATLSLGNLVRRDAHSSAIVRPPIVLAPDLAALLEPDADIKVKHGVLGLLKHLAQSQNNRVALGDAGIIQRLASSQVWAEKTDMIEIIQVSAIGVAKHMCNSNVENSLTLVLPSPEMSAPLSELLALVRRSDSIAVKSEGTRVLVNAIKSLWSSEIPSGAEATAQRREDAKKAVLIPSCASALAQLVGRSKRYPILIHEGVVALSLLSTHEAGGTLVLDAILNPLPTETIRSSQSQPISAVTSDGSPVVGPRRTLDMLTAVLRSSQGNIAPEVRANVCGLLGQLGRAGVVKDDRKNDVDQMKDSTRELLENAARETEETLKVFSGAARRALEAWA
ncbi:hypothetical protein B0H21DRAFT_718473 [Amylocystis lapponica]|nr:hypothetical protein B0H21DRAFT_718473 [Amylocystis lapponica]